jgi:Spy/CpxP family protein refolding chaperone
MGRKIMKRIVVVALTMMFVGMGVSAAFAQMMGMGSEERHEMMGMGGGRAGGYMHGGCFSHFEVLKELDLSEGQEEKLRVLKSKFRKAMVMVNASLKVAMIEFGELMASDILDMRAVEDKIGEITELKGRHLMSAAEASEEARNILSREQLKKARKLIRKSLGACGPGGRGMMRRGWSDDD